MFLLVFTEMQGQGLEPNVITYSALISACAAGDNAETALQVFAEVQRKGFVSLGITCNALINACAKNNNADKAFQLLVVMQQTPVLASIFLQ